MYYLEKVMRLHVRNISKIEIFGNFKKVLYILIFEIKSSKNNLQDFIYRYSS